MVFLLLYLKKKEEEEEEEESIERRISFIYTINKSSL